MIESATMHPRFEAFRTSELGKSIEALARKPERMTEYALLSRLEMPAVIALSWDVSPLLDGLSEDELRTTKQFCGAIVGEVLRENGYEIVSTRASAKAGGVFTFGAVWGSPKQAHDRAIQIARKVMKDYEGVFRALARS